MTTQTINFTYDRFHVHGWPAVAVRVVEYDYEEHYDEIFEEVERIYIAERVRVVMVGDDRVHIVDTDDLEKIEDEDYCSCCGQIGCGWG